MILEELVCLEDGGGGGADRGADQAPRGTSTPPATAATLAGTDDDSSAGSSAGSSSSSSTSTTTTSSIGGGGGEATAAAAGQTPAERFQEWRRALVAPRTEATFPADPGAVLSLYQRAGRVYLSGLLPSASAVERQSMLMRSSDADCQYAIHRSVVLLVDGGRVAEAFRTLRRCLKAPILPKRFRTHLMQVTAALLLRVLPDAGRQEDADAHQTDAVPAGPSAGSSSGLGGKYVPGSEDEELALLLVLQLQMMGRDAKTHGEAGGMGSRAEPHADHGMGGGGGGIGRGRDGGGGGAARPGSASSGTGASTTPVLHSVSRSALSLTNAAWLVLPRYGHFTELIDVCTTTAYLHEAGHLHLASPLAQPRCPALTATPPLISPLHLSPAPASAPPSRSPPFLPLPLPSVPCTWWRRARRASGLARPWDFVRRDAREI